MLTSLKVLSSIGLAVFTVVVVPVVFAQETAEVLPPPAKIQVDFTRHVEPIFKKRCQACHGAQQQMNGLRLDRRQDALKGGYSGVVIQPGDSASSKLIRLVAGVVPKTAMPPAGPKLTTEEIGILRAWIDQGASWPAGPDKLDAAAPKSSHWSFQPIRKAQPPAVTGVRNPIDSFVRARLKKELIEPSPEADKITLLRRLSLDLIGLPPTPVEIAQFRADTTAGAYERQVERLLASPHYGEQWGRHWLDLARYADSDGYEGDRPRPNAWRYRQWVIEAFNRDMPFDRFTTEQLAGDLLPQSTVEQKVATGFHRNTLTNREGGVDTEQFRVEQALDRTNTLGTVWLGLTVGCAQCHDHKYDPISQKEYYGLFAFFNPLNEEDIDAPVPGELGPYLQARPEYGAKRDALLREYRIPELQIEWERKLLHAAANPGDAAWDRAWKFFGNNTNGGQAVVRLDPSKRTPKQKELLENYLIARFNEGFGKERLAAEKIDELRKKLQELDAKTPRVSEAPAVAEFGEPRKTHILMRGDFRDKGMEVEKGVPAFLPALDGTDRSRLALARWLLSRDNPLTARVAVNRIWQEYFGRGLVRTSEDFGKQGEKPSHPELLDWLAAEFMDRGWSMKQMHRLIVTSATYRQSSKGRPELQDRDPDNTLLARQSRLRLPAEQIRDSALAVSGLLNPAIGGKSVRPAQPAGVAELGYANAVKWVESQGSDRYRRGLYIHFQRTVPYPQLMNFDAPDSNMSCSRRQRSTTPLQALNLLNDPVFFEAAQALALRIVQEAPAGFRNRLDYGFHLCLARPAKQSEAEKMARYFDKQIGLLAAAPEEARALFPHRLAGVDPLEAGAWTAASRVLLNLDEFIHRE